MSLNALGSLDTLLCPEDVIVTLVKPRQEVSCVLCRRLTKKFIEHLLCTGCCRGAKGEQGVLSDTDTSSRSL